MSAMTPDWLGQYVRVGTQYFTFDATSNMSSQDAVELVKKHLQSQLRPA